MDTFEYDIEGAAYDDLIIAARSRGKEFFRSVNFDFTMCVIEAPNLKDWYQAHVVAKAK